jgi:prepilin-type N-terminal cleavage/methylation domain-containing protein
MKNNLSVNAKKRSWLAKDRRGMTLVELVITISIIGILVIALGFEFTGWMGSYNVESQVKALHMDLLDARARAMTKHRVHFVLFNSPTEYTIYEDDSDGTNKTPDGNGSLETAGAAPDTQLPSFPKTIEYTMDWNNAGIGSAVTVPIDTRGLADSTGSISFFVDKDSDGKRDFTPDYDCIAIDVSRIKMGKIKDNGTTIRSDDTCDINR